MASHPVLLTHPPCPVYAAQMIFKVSVHNARLDIPRDPERCPPALARLLTACWDSIPDKRPSAEEISEQLHEVLASLCKEKC